MRVLPSHKHNPLFSFVCSCQNESRWRLEGHEVSTAPNTDLAVLVGLPALGSGAISEWAGCDDWLGMTRGSSRGGQARPRRLAWTIGLRRFMERFYEGMAAGEHPGRRWRQRSARAWRTGNRSSVLLGGFRHHRCCRIARQSMTTRAAILHDDRRDRDVGCAAPMTSLSTQAYRDRIGL